MRKVLIILSMLTLVLLSACSGNRAGNIDDREALFDYIIERTAEREAFSPVKNAELNMDPLQNMRDLREDFITAETDQALFHVLVKLSNARKDRHLSVTPVNGGLDVDRYNNLQAPIRFATDFSTDGSWFFFAADFSKDIAGYTGDVKPEPGDRLISVNGLTVDEYFRRMEPYVRYSSVSGLWWKFAEGISVKHFRIPEEMYGEYFDCTLEGKSGQQYNLSLPYLKADGIEWQGIWKNHGDFRYPGFSKLLETQTFDLYRAQPGKKVLLLDWYGFRQELVKDIDQLAEYASKNGLLDWNIIVDATRSRGGSRGAYAIQRLSPKPFKTTFGNLKISDITDDFVKMVRERYDARKVEDSGVRETIDDGTWLIEWLEDDVMKAVQSGQEYSNNVPFKLAHAPKYSDGVLQPAEIHFTGKLVCFLGPHGGSHLDQFAAIVADNDLGHLIGMPSGGYSNTWEWSETLVFPNSGKPVARFMWNIGHTIRPNGEILEGKAADVDEFIPLTKDNFMNYYEILIDRAFTYLGVQ